ncbi:MAG: hypothetical protein WD793_11040 [Steroidobacteraceae bacterium]
MQTNELISLLENAVKQATDEGLQSVELVNLKAYVGQLRNWQEEDEKRGYDATNQALRLEEFRGKVSDWLEDRKRTHETNLEMFRSVIQAGQGALRTCLLINGGAAVALLAFAGHIVSSETEAVPLVAVAKAMVAFVGGVLACGLASGTTYLSQWFFADDWNRTGFVLNVAAIIFGLGSLALFAFGGYLAYCLFASL